MLERLLTKQGNTVGFTAAGKPVCGHYLSKSKAWAVWVGEMSLADPSAKRFPTQREAEDYAFSLCDAEKTRSLRWW